jgi:plastocyanin
MNRQGCHLWRASWRRLIVAMGAFAGMLVVGSSVPAAAPPGEAPSIEIRQHQYRPSALTVEVGSTVTWVNHDEDIHTVTSSDEVFTSRGIDTDETFSHTFTKSGTYQYFCRLHPLMTATIIVK